MALIGAQADADGFLQPSGAGRAQQRDVVHQVPQRVAGQTVPDQVMRVEAGLDRLAHSATATEQIHRPADLGIVKGWVRQRHGGTSVICRK